MFQLLDAAGAAAPPLALRAGAFVLFALSAFILAIHVAMLAIAARTARGVRRPTLVAASAAVFLAIWFGLAMIVGDGANFPLAGGAPERILLSVLVIVVPVTAALALLAWSPTMRMVNTAMPAEWLIWAQSYRALGFIFLYPYLRYGVVASGFAWPAALGDMITGVAAIFVGVAVMQDRPGAARLAVAWNIFGLLDLVAAPVAALLSGTRIIATYPLALVALFSGPPLGIIVHVYSLRNLRQLGRARRHAAPLPHHAGSAVSAA